MIRRTWLFAGRTMKEEARDPTNLFFALAFPVLLLWMMHTIDNAIPEGGASKALMAIDSLAPGIVSFATVFMALFTGMVLARDRESAFLTRLFASPMGAGEFLAGYTLPMLAIALVQAAITFLVSMAMGLRAGWSILAACLLTVPTALMYVAVGLLAGSLMSANAVGGVCGAVLTLLAGWCSGVWMPIELLGDGFRRVCDVLPFLHAAKMTEACLHGAWNEVWPNLWPVLTWAIVLYAIATMVFAHAKRDR
ncbi:MAG: ABC transporter permease [Bifidobacterium sp.]|nr:ABC transporter permease [Bifidobacterium sp.]